MMSVIFTFAIALLGVMVFIFANLPLPWLLGPITFCLVGALLGVPMKGVKPLNDTMRTILGVAVGATLTPAVMGDIAGMWPTLLLMPVMVVAIGVVGIPFFTRVCGYDKATAYYSAMSGGLQDMLLFGEEAGGNIRTLSLIHATRVLVVVVALPFMLKGIWDADLSNPPGLPAIDVPVLDLLIMIVCAFAGWRIAKFFGLFGASILGPLILTAIVTMLGLLENRPPAEAIWAAQFFIGMTIGAKYAGITAQEVRKDVTAGFGFCVILIVLTTIFAGGIYELGLAPGMETLLAFTPGGQAELTVLALIVGADMAFVVAHHIVRIFVVILGAPVMNRLLWPK